MVIAAIHAMVIQASLQARYTRPSIGGALVGKILDKRYVVLEEVGADGPGFRYLVYDMNSLNRVHLRVDPDRDGELTGKAFELVDQSTPLGQAAPTPAPSAQAIAPQQTSPDGAAPPQPKVRLVTPPGDQPEARPRTPTPVGFGPAPVHTTKIPRTGIDESAPSLAALVNQKDESPKLSLVAQRAVDKPGALEQALEKALDPANQQDPDPANMTQPIDLASAEEILGEEAHVLMAPDEPVGERPRLRTRQLEAAWFAQGEQLEEDPVEETASIPKFDQDDLERAAADLSPDEYRKYALDLPPPVLPPAKIVEAFLEAPPRIATPAVTPATLPPATLPPATLPPTPAPPVAAAQVAPAPVPAPVAARVPAPVPAPVAARVPAPVPAPVAAPAPVPVVSPAPTPAPAVAAPVPSTPPVVTASPPSAAEIAAAIDPTTPPPADLVPPPVQSATPDPVPAPVPAPAPAPPQPLMATLPTPLSKPVVAPSQGSGMAYAGTALRPESESLLTTLLGAPYIMLAIGLFMGGLVSGTVTCLVTPSQKDLEAAVSAAVKAAAAQPAPMQPVPAPAPAPARDPALEPPSEAVAQPEPQPEPVAKPAPKPQPKARRLNRRQRKRLKNYLYLARKALKRRRYGSVRHWSSKALKIQPASRAAQLLKDRADSKLER
jgi:hypothetical protein